ncbi:hypothetical protein PPYR_10769 [Photinus pyralis]|uniref:Purine nucleoside phosphorylase n=1 Tax=Photinus pyralis TaxID=7054 RepID=A0A1Y1MAZ9_PHOPY|nr:purine nucleoside phosphorylase-like isoform X2 [Photinus pyralis]KAB0796708.1 hypothetical protein PPYR_10769 [Photinus pyralis]
MNGTCELKKRLLNGASNGHAFAVENETSNDQYYANNNVYSYEAVVNIAEYLLDRVPYRPRIGIICGSGMGSLAEALSNPIKFPYEDIPNFPVSTVEGHAGQLVFGRLSGVPVMCMQGRFHYYEGYPLWKCAMPVRVMKMVGVTHLIATNAAGGLNKTYKVGDIMLVKDHINMMGFAGNNPLQGPNEARFGPRFPPMNTAYDKQLVRKAKEIAALEGLGDLVHDGVYTCLGGPSFETVAELKMLGMLGVDAVGMSTVHEVITARHCNMSVFAFSLITNMCITDYDCGDEANHCEVLDVGKLREADLRHFVSKIVVHLAHNM